MKNNDCDRCYHNSDDCPYKCRISEYAYATELGGRCRQFIQSDLIVDDMVQPIDDATQNEIWVKPDINNMIHISSGSFFISKDGEHVNG